MLQDVIVEELVRTNNELKNEIHLLKTESIVLKDQPQPNENVYRYVKCCASCDNNRTEFDPECQDVLYFCPFEKDIVEYGVCGKWEGDLSKI